MALAPGPQAGKYLTQVSLPSHFNSPGEATPSPPGFPSPSSAAALARRVPGGERAKEGAGGEEKGKRGTEGRSEWRSKGGKNGRGEREGQRGRRRKRGE